MDGREAGNGRAEARRNEISFILDVYLPGNSPRICPSFDGRGQTERRAFKKDAGANAAGSAARPAVGCGAVRCVDDARRVSAEDAVSGSEHFGAVATPPRGETRVVSGGEAAPGLARGAADECTGEGVGVQGEGVSGEQRRRRSARQKSKTDSSVRRLRSK
jgi:hypothetical protein